MRGFMTKLVLIGSIILLIVAIKARNKIDDERWTDADVDNYVFWSSARSHGTEKENDA